MIITIYLGPLKGALVDATHIEEGNPGIGGTQYCMLELAHYLNGISGFDVNLLGARPYVVEQGIQYYIVNGDDDVCHVAEKINTDIFILSQFNNKYLEKQIGLQRYKVIIWTHNYILYPFCKFITETPQIVCNVFVGKQLYDRYLDDDVIRKSVYIYNMYSDKNTTGLRDNDQKTVVYMGAIIPGKGFAELCSIWPKIIKRVPHAQLLVMGSGRLYGDAKLGKLGIADENYENQFLKYITDEDGKIIPSVKFLGVVGDGKEEIFRKASVGVVNPSGRTETFGMGILEMGEVKLPVVTIGKNGYYDTIVNGISGILSNNLNSMVDDIISLISNPHKNAIMGENAKLNNKRFIPSVIGPQWIDLLTKIQNKKCVFNNLPASAPYSNNFKWIRIIIQKLRFDCRIRFIPSVIKIESLIYKMLHH